MEDLIGNTIWNYKKEPLKISEELKNKTLIGLYYSAGWAPQSKIFDQKLSEFFN